MVVRRSGGGALAWSRPQKQVTGACSNTLPVVPRPALGRRPGQYSNRSLRHRRQVLDRETPHRGGGAAGSMPGLRGAQPPRGRAHRAPRARGSGPGSVGSARRHRAARGDRGPGPPVRVPGVRRRTAGRAGGRSAAAALLSCGHRTCSGGLEPRGEGTGRGPSQGESVEGGRRRRSRRLGLSSPLDQGGSGWSALSGRSRSPRRGSPAQGRSAHRDDARGAGALVAGGPATHDTRHAGSRACDPRSISTAALGISAPPSTISSRSWLRGRALPRADAVPRRLREEPSMDESFSKSTKLAPKDHAEEVAIFRSEIVGALTRRISTAANRRRAAADCPGALPAAGSGRHAQISFRRWSDGTTPTRRRARCPAARAPQGSRPRPQPHRGAAGFCCSTSAASTPPPPCPLILRTLVLDGRLQQDAVSASTVRRLFPARASTESRCATARSRRPGCAGRPSGPARSGTATSATARRSPSTASTCRCASTDFSTMPPASSSRWRRTTPSARWTCWRCFVTRCAGTAPPDALYLDNGATYRGDISPTACARHGHLPVARQALRPAGARQDGALLAHACGRAASTFFGQVRRSTTSTCGCWPSSTSHYHDAPHASLLGRSPGTVSSEPQNVPPTLSTRPSCARR